MQPWTGTTPIVRGCFVLHFRILTNLEKGYLNTRISVLNMLPRSETEVIVTSGTAYLLSQLSGRSQHQSLSLLLLYVQLLQDRDGKRGRLASA